ncbi:Carboxy-terminal domain protein [Spatholobus suberectus]|nr:Carboxy-terminal domain protein [Spatholobus suberectus]
MLMDKSFYDHPHIVDKHVISNFSLVEPRGLGHQRIGSNDCGVWVAKWMIECAWREDYDQIFVEPATRMRIALDLVLHPYNELKDKIIQKAFQYWTDLEKKRKSLGVR